MNIGIMECSQETVTRFAISRMIFFQFMPSFWLLTKFILNFVASENKILFLFEFLTCSGIF